MEQQFLKWLAANLPASPQAPLGISDDAAVLTWAGGDLVVTTDVITDLVDFRLEKAPPALVGHKALGVNLSDLAAMAAVPVAAFISLALPRGGGAGLDAMELAVEIYRGILPLAKEFELAIAGGDTNVWDGPLAISVTALGRTTRRGPLTRRGAKLGDAIVVTGRLGGSILGRHLRVEPRVREALELHEQYELHAGMDISDGLALDASRLAAASGCGVALRTSLIPLSADAISLAATTGKSPLEHALGDGEDFELLLAVSPATADRMAEERRGSLPVTAIGKCVAEPGLWELMDDDSLKPLEPSGFLH